MKTLANDTILEALKSFVLEENKLIKQILEYLEEVENRKLFLDRGFSSMFAFCTEFLGYTAQKAQVRIQAMRLGKVVPDVKNKIESGALSLTIAAKVQGHIMQENKIKREAKQGPITAAQAHSIIQSVENKSVQNSEKLLLEMFPHHADKKPDMIKTVSSNTIRVEMNLTKETFESLRKLQALRVHAHRDRNFEAIISDLCKLGEKKWDIEKKMESSEAAQVIESAGANATLLRASAVKQGRYIPAALRRMIWIRDHGECQYRDLKTGRICRDRFGLQLDHIKPYALGGDHSEENLRLLCWRHNSHRAWATFGRTKSKANPVQP